MTSSVPLSSTGGRASQRGSVARAMLWLVGGLLVFVILVPLTAPEVVLAGRREGVAVLGDSFVGLGLAAVPGSILLVVLAVRRRRRERADGEV
jgi:hypothetical protein